MTPLSPYFTTAYYCLPSSFCPNNEVSESVFFLFSISLYTFLFPLYALDTHCPLFMFSFCFFLFHPPSLFPTLPPFSRVIKGW